MSMCMLMCSNDREIQTHLLEAKTKIDDHKIVPKLKKNLLHLVIIFRDPIAVKS